MKKVFYTKYDRPPKIFVESCGGPSLVETAGYITAEQRINNLISAGRRLVEARKYQYDFPDGKIPDGYSDPTRSKDFDMSDATQIDLKLAEIAEQKKALIAQESELKKLQKEDKSDGQNNTDKGSKNTADNSNNTSEGNNASK